MQYRVQYVQRVPPVQLQRMRQPHARLANILRLVLRHVKIALGVGNAQMRKVH